MAKRNTIEKRMDELKAGDVVFRYHCLFRLVSVNYDSIDRHDGKRVINWKTELVEYSPEGGMPRHWADDWSLQSVDWLMHSVVVD